MPVPCDVFDVPAPHLFAPPLATEPLLNFPASSALVRKLFVVCSLRCPNIFAQTAQLRVEDGVLRCEGKPGLLGCCGLRSARCDPPTDRRAPCARR